MATLLIAGTTASGKSDLAITIAKEVDAVIVSADAMTVYRGLDVGTAKPSIQERTSVPHFGIDIRNLGEAFDVSEFIGLVEHVQKLHPRVIVAGGTTFWLQALLNPLANLPGPDLAIRAELEKLEEPHRLLESLDPAAAARLHPNDRVRVVRALEVHRLTGKTQTELHKEGPRRTPIDARVIWLDRDDLRERIDARLLEMWPRGYLDEARWALTEDPNAVSKPLKSFAYRHLIEHLNGGVELDEAKRRTARDTWHFARKQRTWARGLDWSAALDENSVDRAKAWFQRDQ